MTRWLIAILTLCLFPVLAGAAGVEPPKHCVNCGMDRQMFAYSRAVVTYADGKSDGTCSLNCAVEAIGKSGKQASSLKVADYYTRELVEAKDAVWVVGGKKGGVMTSVAKWAFADRGGAERFVRENGGSITQFGKVLQAVEQEIEEMDKAPDLEDD